MNVTAEYNGDILIVKPQGELMGGPEADRFKDIIDEALRRSVAGIVVDMTGVNWMNSSGLGMLVAALAKVRGAGGDLKLAALSERVRRPLQLTRLDSVFEQYDSVEEALKTFGRA